MTQALRTTIDKWALMKLQRFCKAKATIKRANQQSTDWKTIFSNPIYDRGQISKVYKEIKKIDTTWFTLDMISAASPVTPRGRNTYRWSNIPRIIGSEVRRT